MYRGGLGRKTVCHLGSCPAGRYMTFYKTDWWIYFNPISPTSSLAPAQRVAVSSALGIALAKRQYMEV